MEPSETDTPAWADAEGRLGAVLGTPLFIGGQSPPLVSLSIAPLLWSYATLDGLRVRAEEATRWERSFAEVIARAVANMAERPPRLEREERWLRVEADDEHAATRLLVPGFLDAAQAEVEGRVLFAIPTANTCLIIGGADPKGLAELYDVAFEMWHQSDEPLSPVIYTRSDDGDTIEPLVLSDDHPCWIRARRAEALVLATVYADQRASLEGFDDAPELAPFEVVPDDDLGVVTATMAFEDAPALLPGTALVMLRFAGDETPHLVPADALFEARLLVRVPDFDPPRYGLVRFPSAIEIEEFSLGSDP